MFLGFACGKEHNPPQASGVAIGIVNTAVVASGAVMQPLIGWLLDLNWTGEVAGGVRVYGAAAYQTAMALLPLSVLLSTLAAYLMREPPRAGTAQIPKG